jgi:hypothetical protein
MQPRMSQSELALFLSFVRKSERYLEFGTGGSTFVATSHPKTWIISIDSSQPWLAEVSSACSGNTTKPELIFKDIGSTSDWGYPIDLTTKANCRITMLTFGVRPRVLTRICIWSMDDSALHALRKWSFIVDQMLLLASMILHRVPTITASEDFTRDRCRGRHVILSTTAVDARKGR